MMEAYSWAQRHLRHRFPEQAVVYLNAVNGVTEQFVCLHPMEGHTANWLETLMVLRRATGREVYRQKAIAAANAIVEFQADDGRFLTFGPDRYLRQAASRSEWFAANAQADWALLQFAGAIEKE